MAKDDTGPHLITCVFCEKVIEDKEGVLSLIRIVDRITQTATGSEPPEQMPPFILDTLQLAITLKADQARGRYAIKVRPEDPGGRQLPAFEAPLQLVGGNQGVNLIMALQFAVELEGVYWFDVFFVAAKNDDRLLTRLPLEVIYQPQKTGS